MSDTIFSKLQANGYLPIGFPVHGIKLEDLRASVASGGFSSDNGDSYVINIPGSHDQDVDTAQLGDLSDIPAVVTIPNPGGTALSIVSSSVNDTIAGSGAQKVTVFYLNDDFLQTFKTVDMNGQTAVPLGLSDIQNVEYTHTSQVAVLGGVAAGNISLVDTATGTIVYEYIKAGNNQSTSARWTVPDNGFGILFDWTYSGLKKRIDFFLRATCHRVSRELIENVFLFQDVARSENTTGPSRKIGPLYLPPRCQVKISVKADGNGGEAGGSFGVGWVPNV